MGNSESSPGTSDEDLLHDGEVRQIDDASQGYDYNHYPDKRRNDQRYEEICLIIERELHKKLEEDYDLQKLPVPRDSTASAPRSFVFASQDWRTNEKLIVLIQGNGAVRAGMWARKLILNNGLDQGSQIPDVLNATVDGFAVVIMNPNENKKGGASIKGSSTPEEHAESVWRDYVSPSSAKHIAIIAHSYGSVITTTLMKKFRHDFLTRVFAIAYTDGVTDHQFGDIALQERYNQITRNWVTSSSQYGSVVKRGNPGNAGILISSGVTNHSSTASYARKDIQNFFRLRLAPLMENDQQVEELGRELLEGVMQLDANQSLMEEVVCRPEVQIDMDHPLGSGGFGTVLPGVWSGSPVAIKFIKDIEWDVSELKIMKQVPHALGSYAINNKRELRHPNICNFYGTQKVGGTYALVLERCEADLSKVAQSCDDKTLLKKYIRDSCSGLAYIHAKELLHMDIKPQNILIQCKVAKLCDFGITQMAGQLQDMSQTSFWPGTPLFKAPELYTRYKPTVKSDIYSVGITYVYIVTGEQPWKKFVKKNGCLIPADIVQKQLPEAVHMLPAADKALMLRVLDYDQTKRPDAEELVKELGAILAQ